MAQSNREFLGTEPVKPLIFKMAGPSIIAQMITTFYNIVDTYFVSQLGKAATAAVGVNSNIERLISLVATLIGGGAGSYVARLLGNKRDEDANRVVTTSTVTGFVIGAVITAVGLIILSPLVDFLGATPECKQYSMEYGSYVLYAAPFIIASTILNMILRSEGSSTFAMMGLGFGGILNCVLDPIFIFKLNLGVAGASMATAISKVVSFAILLYPYIAKKAATKLNLKFFRYKWEHIKEVISVGMTGFMRTLLGVISMILLNRIAGSYSTALLAAISVGGRIMMFPFATVLGFGMGFQPVVGYSWGAGRMDRVKESFRFSLKVALIGGLVLGSILIVFARPLIGLFNSEADEMIYKYGALTIRTEAATLVIHTVGMIINSFFAATGKGGYSVISSMSRQGYCFIPMIYLLPRLLGVEGLCYAQAAADVLTILVYIPLGIIAFKLIKEEEAKQAAQKPAA